MDVKHKKAYATVKLPGQRELIQLNEGESIIQLMQRITRELHNAPARYGRVTIEMDFNPFGQSMTQQEKDYAALLEGLDLTGIEIETEEEAAIWDNSPMNPASPNYDPLYHEYQNCTSPGHRAIKTPDDLGLLRKHVESKYRGTQWWDGSHRW